MQQSSGLCDVCYEPLRDGTHFAEVNTRNFGTQVVCAECIVQFAEKRVDELEAENARLRSLLRPIAEQFVGVLVQERLHDGQVVGSHAMALGDSHLRACCAELGIVVKEGTSYE